MKFIGPHLQLRKAQQNALLILVVLLLCIPFINDFVKISKPIQWDEKAMAQHQKWIDSTVKSDTKKLNLYPFDPNYLSDYRAYMLGMERHSFDRLMAHRKLGKWINSAEQFQWVAGVDDELMAVLSPYLTFPEWKKTSPQNTKKVKKIGLNHCQAADLEIIYGVGKKLSQRIINYRKYLKGYSDLDQLYEVYGLDSALVQRIQKRFDIKVLPQMNKLLLDTVSYDELKALPYISAQDARNIIKWRSSNTGIGFGDLQNIEGFDSLKIERISLYLQTF
jgi:competence protein ComEA